MALEVTERKQSELLKKKYIQKHNCMRVKRRVKIKNYCLKLVGEQTIKTHNDKSNVNLITFGNLTI